jgi:hypothetical protein
MKKEIVSVPLRGKDRKLPCHIKEITLNKGYWLFPSPCGEKIENYVLYSAEEWLDICKEGFRPLAGKR